MQRKANKFQAENKILKIQNDFHSTYLKDLTGGARYGLSEYLVVQTEK